MKNFQRVALLASAANLLASAVMLLFLNRAISPEIPIATKILALTHPPSSWTISWLVWMFAALSLILFFVHWGIWMDGFTRGEYRPWILFGVLLGCLGMIPDTLAETLYLGALPRLAKQATAMGGTETAVRNFADWEFNARLLTGFLGNGFYALGGLVLQSLALKAGSLPTFCRYFGFAVWASALGLSAAVLASHTYAIYACTASTMATFVLWSALVGILAPPEPAT